MIYLRVWNLDLSYYLKLCFKSIILSESIWRLINIADMVMVTTKWNDVKCIQKEKLVFCCIFYLHLMWFEAQQYEPADNLRIGRKIE